MWVLVEITPPRNGAVARVIDVTGLFRNAKAAIQSILGDTPIYERVIADSTVENHFSINGQLFAAMEISHVDIDAVQNMDKPTWECAQCPATSQFSQVSLEEHIRIRHPIDDEIPF